ncbi:ATP-grasp domain-containing protein [Brachybacterium epidermidis]|nr:ATP-grasp domain-containing protein [Brachybacterium epidermidis]
MRERGILVPGVDRAWQLGCADKLRMAQLLEGIGMPTPRTVTGDDEAGIAEIPAASERLVVKHRLGSGSSGLALVPADGVRAAIDAAIDSAPAPADGSAPSGQDVVVQPCLPGLEHGVDIVGDLREPGELRAVLARRKVRMRAGETDKAASVDPAPFVANAEKIARAAQLTGLIDTDMFLAEGGEPSVIDINPPLRRRLPLRAPRRGRRPPLLPRPCARPRDRRGLAGVRPRRHLRQPRERARDLDGGLTLSPAVLLRLDRGGACDRGLLAGLDGAYT